MVKFLSMYISKQRDHNIQYKVDIKQEIENFKRKFPDIERPIIVFDFIATIRIFVYDYEEVMFAGRHQEFVRRAAEFFQNLQDLGADLVFFLEGPLKEVKLPKYIRRMNQKYDERKQIFASLKAQERIRYRFEKFLIAYHSNYKRIAKRFGRLSISLENECDIDIAEFATRANVLAVISQDSDFLIMPGDWSIWLPSEFNVWDMTVDARNKKKLRESLGLEQWQMPIYAALSGCNWIEYEHVEHLRKGSRADIVRAEKAFADFIKSNFENQKDVRRKLIDLIYNRGYSKLPLKEIERLVEMTLEFYDNKACQVSRVEPEWLRKHIYATADSDVFKIYKRQIMTISHAYVDISKCQRSFADIVLPIDLRLIGIVHNNCPEKHQNFKMRFCLKANANVAYCINEYAPIYPNFEVPNIEDILSTGKNAIPIEKRVEILSWILSAERYQVSVSNIMELLNTIFIVPALIVNYLVQEGIIASEEADIILLSVFEASRMDPLRAEEIRLPDSIQEQPFWLAHLYTNLVHTFNKTLRICGLHRYIPYSYFDGYLFHRMYGRFKELPSIDKLSLRHSILQYRLYDA